MNTLVKKEIRLLLPAFVGALALALVPIWFQGYEPINLRSDLNVLPAEVNLFGILLLALSSYGREMGLKTLPFTLAQPVERARIWRTKLAVLAVAATLVYDVWLTSTSLRCCFQPGLVLPPHLLAGFGFVCLVFITSGLWMTLLLRQIVAAFFLSILVPVGVGTVIGVLGGTFGMIAAVAAVYAAAAFFLARWQFLIMQDAAWTGGVIFLDKAWTGCVPVFGGGRADAKRSALHECRPWAALIWKELQLQQITLIGMACMLVLHIGVLMVRHAGINSFNRTTLMVLESFGALWFIVPVLAGSQSVAEERKFGTMQAHLCLPISRRAQCFLKLMVVLLIGCLSSWALYWTVEEVAGIPHLHGDFIQTAFLFPLLALAGFYGSTLTGGVVQALAATALTLLGLFASVVLPFEWRFRITTGILPLFIGWPVMVSTVLWLACRNFGHATESWPLWRRNLLALAGMAVFSFGLTVAIYHRAWEWLTPLESPPGPVRLSVEKPPALYTYGGRGVAALLPEGRLWVDRLSHRHDSESFGQPFDQELISLGDNEFAPGSNWVDAMANSRETVAIRSDGTLWVSEKPRKLWDVHSPPIVEASAGLVRFGQESNWLGVARLPDRAMFLLRRDGTLWTWGDNTLDPKHANPSLRDSQPRRLGQETNWAKLQKSDGWVYAFAWKTDGAAWILHGHRSTPVNPMVFWKLTEQDLERGVDFSRVPCLDHTQWRCLRVSDQSEFAGVRDDGTLWCWDDRHTPAVPRSLPRGAAILGKSFLVQIGKDSDWAELAALSWERVVARKTDGSLWKWHWATDNDWRWQPFMSMLRPPVQLGTRNDWVALGVVGPDILSLAADGNLWGWLNPAPVSFFGENSGLYLAASRKPSRVENIFGEK